MIRPTVALLLCALLACASCSSDSEQAVPSAPSPPVPTSAATHTSVWGYVLTADQKCIEGAVVEVVDSSASALIGQKSHQSTCSFDDGIGYRFELVPIGTRFTLRASKEGYRSQTIDTIGNNPAPPARIVLLRD